MYTLSLSRVPWQNQCTSKCHRTPHHPHRRSSQCPEGRRRQPTSWPTCETINEPTWLYPYCEIVGYKWLLAFFNQLSKFSNQPINQRKMQIANTKVVQRPDATNKAVSPTPSQPVKSTLPTDLPQRIKSWWVKSRLRYQLLPRLQCIKHAMTISSLHFHQPKRS